MQALRPQFERFLRRAHRRFTLLRLLEGAGLGILGGCAAGLPLVGILAYRGADGFGAASIAIAIGAAAGLLWGWLTRPSRMATALEADRQLGWADLLGSAILIRARSNEDPFAAAVVAEADARCRATTPGALVLHRLGARTWGGIGLASALVLVLGLLPTFAAPTRADEHANAARGPLALLQGEEPPVSNTAGPVPRRAHRQQDPDDPNASRMGAEDVPSARPSDSAKGSPIDEARHSTQSADASSHGGGAGQSKTDHPGQLRAAQPTGAQSPDGAREGAGGTGRASAGSGNGAGSGQSAGQASETARRAPPWQSSEWPAQGRRAMDAVESGKLPDAYRDVIREYFDRP